MIDAVTLCQKLTLQRQKHAKMESKSIKEVPKGDLDRRLDSGASFCLVWRFLVSDCWCHLGDFVPFGRPLDFEGVPKSAFFVKNQHKINKTRSKKGVTRDMICDSIFDAKMTWKSSFGTILVAI